MNIRFNRFLRTLPMVVLMGMASTAGAAAAVSSPSCSVLLSFARNTLDLFFGKRVIVENFKPRTTADVQAVLHADFKVSIPQTVDYSSVEWTLSNNIQEAQNQAESIYQHVQFWHFEAYKKWASTNSNDQRTLDPQAQREAFKKYLKDQFISAGSENFFLIRAGFIDSTWLTGDNALQVVRLKDGRNVLRLRLLKQGNDKNVQIVAKISNEVLNGQEPLTKVSWETQLGPDNTMGGIENLHAYFAQATARLLESDSEPLAENIQAQIYERFAQAFLLKYVVDPIGNSSAALSSFVATSIINDFTEENSRSITKVDEIKQFILKRIPELASKPGFASAFLTNRERFSEKVQSQASSIVGQPKSFVFEDKVAFSVNGNIRVEISILAEATGVLRADGTVELINIKIPGAPVEKRRLFDSVSARPHLTISTFPKADAVPAPTQAQINQVLNAFQIP